MDKFSAHQKVVLSIILSSYFIIILDVSVVITGLPKILAELHFSSTSLSWVQSAYTLTFGGFLLLGARAGDILGRKKMYLTGAVTSTIGMSALVFGIVNSATDGWTGTVTLTAIIAGLILLLLFVLNERSAPQPIMPLRLLAHRVRAGAYITRIFFLGGMVGFFFFITQYLQLVKGFTPFAAGIAFMPMTLVNFVAAIQAQRLSRIWGNARLLSYGLMITFAGIFCLTFVTADTSALLALRVANTMTMSSLMILCSFLAVIFLIARKPKVAGELQAGINHE